MPDPMEKNITEFVFGKTKMSGYASDPAFMKLVNKERNRYWIRKFILLAVYVACVIVAHYGGLLQQSMEWFQSMISRT